MILAGYPRKIFGVVAVGAVAAVVVERVAAAWADRLEQDEAMAEALLARPRIGPKGLMPNTPIGLWIRQPNGSRAPVPISSHVEMSDD